LERGLRNWGIGRRSRWRRIRDWGCLMSF